RPYPLSQDRAPGSPDWERSRRISLQSAARSLQTHRPVLEGARPSPSTRPEQSPPKRRSRSALELKCLNRPHSEMRPTRDREYPILRIDINRLLDSAEFGKIAQLLEERRGNPVFLGDQQSAIERSEIGG